MMTQRAFACDNSAALAIISVFVIACAPSIPYLFRERELQWKFQSDWDDRVNFVDNRHLRNVAEAAGRNSSIKEHLRWMWGPEGVILGVYEPFSWSFKVLVVAALRKLNPHIFFFISVALHGTNAVLLAFLNIKIVRYARRQRGDLFIENTAPLDWLASIVAVGAHVAHPLRVEVVGWLSCQSYLLGCAFALISLCFHANAFLDYTYRYKGPYIRILMMVISVLFFTAAALCKVTMAPLPVIMVLLDVLLYDRRETWKEQKEKRKTMSIFSLPFEVFLSVGDHFLYFLASAFTFWYAYKANQVGMKPGSTEHGIRHLMAVPSYSKSLSLHEKSVKGAAGFAWYLTHTVWPRNLAIFYPVGKAFSVTAIAMAGPAVLVLVITVCAVVGIFYTSMGLTSIDGVTTGSRQASWIFRIISLVWGSAFCALLPTLGLVQHGWQIYAADRYSYMPMMCFVPLNTYILSGALFRAKASKRGLFLLLSTCALLVGSLIIKSHISLNKWQDSKALWNHAVNYSPSDCIAFYNMGCVLERETDDALNLTHQKVIAKEMFVEALRLDPEYGAAHNNIGYLIEDMDPNDTKTAEYHYQEAIRLNPGHYTAHNNFGKLLHRQARREEAEHHYRTAMFLYPGYVKAIYNLATLLHTKGGRYREREAEILYREAIAVASTAESTSHQIAETYYNLAQLLGTRNGVNDPELVGLLRMALRIKPSYHKAKLTLEHVLLAASPAIDKDLKYKHQNHHG